MHADGTGLQLQRAAVRRRDDPLLDQLHHAGCGFLRVADEGPRLTTQKTVSRRQGSGWGVHERWWWIGAVRGAEWPSRAGSGPAGVAGFRRADEAGSTISWNHGSIYNLNHEEKKRERLRKNLKYVNKIVAISDKTKDSQTAVNI